MKIFYSPQHSLHCPAGEIRDGKLVSPYENQERVSRIIRELEERNLGKICEAEDYGADPVRRLHDEDYLRFLAAAWEEFTAEGRSGEVLPSVWPVRRLGDRLPLSLDGRLGYYSISADTPITEGTWQAALASVNTALSGAQALLARCGNGTAGIFALCRPPGHHAGRDFYGGYCFLNNAAIAAQYLLDNGADRTVALDIDFHHGNGTQSLFYDRSDVLFLSIHGHPAREFPFYSGYAEEQGSGAGEGYNFNYPLSPGTGFSQWFSTFEDACGKVETYLPDYIVVSLGVDTYKNDPISSFKLDTEDYLTCGSRLAGLGIPTLFIMEGGYDLDTIGANVCGVLSGFEAGR